MRQCLADGCDQVCWRSGFSGAQQGFDFAPHLFNGIEVSQARNWPSPVSALIVTAQARATTLPTRRSSVPMAATSCSPVPRRILCPACSRNFHPMFSVAIFKLAPPFTNTTAVAANESDVTPANNNILRSRNHHTTRAPIADTCFNERQPTTHHMAQFDAECIRGSNHHQPHARHHLEQRDQYHLG